MSVFTVPVTSLQFEYYNSVRINEKDDNDNYLELGNEFILEANEHFNNLMVNTTLSNIQLPTNVYNKGEFRGPATGIVETDG